MGILNLSELRERYGQVSKQALLRGKVPWFDPERIEKQGILSLLLSARQFARGRLLDVGCGKKPYRILFDGIVDEYLGIDLSRGNDSAVDACGSALDLPVLTESVETILCTQVLEHLPDPKQAVLEMYRVLKKGGHLILTAPMVWELHGEPFDYFRFTPYGLETLARSSGFEVVYIKATTGVWAVIGQQLSCIFYKLFGKPKCFFDLALKLSLCFLVQETFLLLDKIAHNERESLGHILVAIK
ncbi:MAG: hypothetical protein A2521_13285 [Deltaproteobacteria bacterium RIFOXYD12_FULL_57_12]|nr:MAG: hypothetical protein A2521_13285 [Deltaproteobacteria bacterium RIFOXYD12_FULL_57_12]